MADLVEVMVGLAVVMAEVMIDEMIEGAIVEELTIKNTMVYEVAGKKPFNIFRDSQFYNAWIKQNP